MRKYRILIIFLIFIGGILLAWHFTIPIKIGVILSAETSLGYEENLAVKYFSSKYPRIRFHPVKYIFHNPESITDEDFINAYNDLASQGVSVILSGEISKAGVIVAPLAKKSGIATFGITISTHQLSKKNDNFYRIVTPTNFIGKAQAEYLNKMQVNRVAIVTSKENTAYVDSLASSFESVFKGDRIIIPYTSRKQVINEIFSYQPDYILSLLPETSLINIIVAVNKKKSPIKILSTEWGFDQLLTVFPGLNMDGVSAYTRKGTIMPEYQSIIDDFEETYKIRSTFAAHNTFSILNMIYRSFREAGISAEKINIYFKKPRIYDIAHGKVFLDQFGDPYMQYHYIFQIENSKQLLKEKVKNPYYPW